MKAIRKIPISKPFLGKEEIEAVRKVLESGWIVQGPKTEEFEKLFSQYTKSKFAVAVSSCTTALHLSLEALEIKNNDKVILPSFTFIATANVVEYQQAKPIFCDINLNTFNIDEKKIPEIIEKEKNVKVIIPVNLFGLCANLEEISQIAKNYGLKIIEDCACSLGSFIGNKHSGTFGDTGCFSFHPRKQITTGEGGMIITDSEEIYNKLLILRNHGAKISDYQRHNKSFSFLLPEYNNKGYNYRITDIQSAIGIEQMKKIDYIMEKRKKIAKKYTEFLKNTKVKGKHLSEYLRLPSFPSTYTHSYQSFVVLFTMNESLFEIQDEEKRVEIINEWNKNRNLLMLRLEENGISTRQGTHAVHTLGYYRNKYNFKLSSFINSYAADRLTIALPLYTEMEEEDVNYIVDNIEKVIKEII